MSKWRAAEITLNHPLEGVPLEIVGDGVLGMDTIADGRLLPVVIVNAGGRPDVQRMVEAHLDSLPGDVDSNWGKPGRWTDNVVDVYLQFKNPVRCVVLLRFELTRYSALLDLIIVNQGFYLQPGKPGDRLKNTVDAPRVLVEVPAGEFRAQWEPMLLKAVAKIIRKKGLSRSEAKREAPNRIRAQREAFARRIPRD